MLFSREWRIGGTEMSNSLAPETTHEPTPEILNIAGALPKLPRIAPLMHEMQRHPDIESQFLGAIETVAAEMPVIFPVHPRIRQRLTESGIQNHSSCGSFRRSGPRIFSVS
ncbi:MAG: hypothetical protein AUF67_05450 [Acidobacteria bacterium 13_1_20CM_58_21]|nr:MAG: hypothetical protein AUF67_05450 [Acidobacteria bacterium 13_1_20CM_58_21]